MGLDALQVNKLIAVCLVDSFKQTKWDSRIRGNDGRRKKLFSISSFRTSGVSHEDPESHFFISGVKEEE